MPMFVCSRPSVVLDHFRVPYDVVPPEAAQRPAWVSLAARTDPTRALRWPAFDDPAAPQAARRRFGLGPLVLHGRVLPDDRVREWLPGGHPDEPLAVDGGPPASVWRNGSGGIVLPFDPDEVVTNFWSEGYQAGGNGGGTGRRSLRSAAVTGYYLVRPLIPRQAQIFAR